MEKENEKLPVTDDALAAMIYVSWEIVRSYSRWYQNKYQEDEVRIKMTESFIDTFQKIQESVKRN